MMLVFRGDNFVGVVAVDFGGACYYCCMRHKLNKADCIEMLECRAFYETTDAPMFNHDLAFVFECSRNEVRAVLDGTHPALLDIPIVNRGAGRPKNEPKVKRPVGRPRKHVV